MDNICIYDHGTEISRIVFSRRLSDVVSALDSISGNSPRLPVYVIYDRNIAGTAAAIADFVSGHGCLEIFSHFLIEFFLSHISIPFFASEIKIKSRAQQKHQQPCEQVAELPVQLGHEFEIHSPDSGKECQRDKDGGNNG